MTLLFPFLPDWSGSYKVTRSFKTDIITSRSGKEQRRACRNRARRTLEFTITEMASRVNLVATTMRRTQAAQIYMADSSRSAATVTALAAGAQTVTLSSAPAWLAGPIVLVSGTQMEVRQPGSVSGAVVTFGDTTANAWPAGADVYPALLGYLRPTIDGKRPSDGVFTGQVAFDVTPVSEPEINPPAAPTIFNQREVLLTSPDWGQDVGASFEHPFNMVDFGQGTVAYTVPIAFASRMHKLTLLQMSAAAMAIVEDVFTRAKGQRGEFYMPTWVNELPPAAVAASGATSFQTAGTDVAAAYAGDTVFKALCVAYSDGTFQFAQVASITVSGANSVLNLAAPLTAAIDPATVRMVCWMPACRFASDAMTTEWLTTAVAQSQLNVVTLEDLTPEVDSWE